MRPLSRIALVIFLALALTACSRGTRGQITGADARPDAIPDLTGAYAVNGVDPLGTEYGGTLLIRPGDAAGSYALEWIVVGNVQAGTGTVEGNQLRARWHSAMGDLARDSHGTATYTITDKGELYGTRTADGVAGVGEEKVFPNPRR